MKISHLLCGTFLLALSALGGCTQTHTAGTAARPDYTQGRREVTGSHVPRHVGRPIGAELAHSNPYTHADDIDRDLGVTSSATGASPSHL